MWRCVGARYFFSQTLVALRGGHLCHSQPNPPRSFFRPAASLVMKEEMDEKQNAKERKGERDREIEVERRSAAFLITLPWRASREAPDAHRWQRETREGQGTSSNTLHAWSPQALRLAAARAQAQSLRWSWRRRHFAPEALQMTKSWAQHR